MRYHNVKLKDWRFVAQAPPTPTPTWYTDLDVASDITDNFDSYAIFSGALSTACWTMGTEHYKFGTAAYRFTQCGTGCQGYGRDHLHILKSSVLGQEFVSGMIKIWGYHCTDGGESTGYDKGLFGLIPRFIDSKNFITVEWNWPWNGSYHVCSAPKIVEYNDGSGTLLAQGSSFNLTDDIWYLMAVEVTEYPDHLEIVSRIYDNDGGNLVQEFSGTTTTAQFRDASSHLCGFRAYLYGCNMSSMWLNHFADRFEVWI